jgi:hypothetical protein
VQPPTVPFARYLLKISVHVGAAAVPPLLEEVPLLAPLELEAPLLELEVLAPLELEVPLLELEVLAPLEPELLPLLDDAPAS